MTPSDTARVRELLERVEGATGYDPSLDASIVIALGVPRNTRRWDVTGSVDDALALVERVLPGWKISLFIHHLTGHKAGEGARAELHAPGRPKRIAPQDWKWPKVAACYYAATPALAILAALLEALTTTPVGEGDG